MMNGLYDFLNKALLVAAVIIVVILAVIWL